MMKIYCDLDGVLCNFNGRFYDSYGVQPDDIKNPKTFWKMVEDKGIEWWSGMNWLDDGKILWNFLIDNFDDIEILTGSPYGKAGEYAKIGKEIWVKNNLGNIKVNHKKGRLKWEHCKNKTDILIDDTELVINNWIELGNGIGILHNDINNTLKTLKNIKL